MGPLSYVMFGKYCVKDSQFITPQIKYNNISQTFFNLLSGIEYDGTSILDNWITTSDYSDYLNTNTNVIAPDNSTQNIISLTETSTMSIETFLMPYNVGIHGFSDISYNYSNITNCIVSLYVQSNGLGSQRYVQICFKVYNNQPSIYAYFDIINGVLTDRGLGFGYANNGSKFTYIPNIEKGNNNWWKISLLWDGTAYPGNGVATTNLNTATSGVQICAISSINVSLSPYPTQAQNIAASYSALSSGTMNGIENDIPRYRGDDISGINIWRYKVTTI